MKKQRFQEILTKAQAGNATLGEAIEIMGEMFISVNALRTETLKPALEAIQAQLTDVKAELDRFNAMHMPIYSTICDEEDEGEDPGADDKETA